MAYRSKAVHIAQPLVEKPERCLALQVGGNPLKENEAQEIERLIRKLAFQNAVRYEGKAKVGPVIRKVFAERPILKARSKEIIRMVKRIVEEINELSLPEQRKIVEEKWPELLIKERAKPEERALPPLPNVEKYAFVHTRFCPNPDGALHIGGARAAVLSDEYAKMYHGRMTLRFDDSDPRTKSPIPEAYDWIREDLRWLGIEWQYEIYQSDRMEVYYTYVEKLIEIGAAYVCTCKPEDFRQRVAIQKACPCRGLLPEEQLERWRHMLDGTYREGDAVVRIKTDLKHSNPAVREWPALRIIDTKKHPHPRTGDNYRIWPLFAFCCGVDDHDLQISHILRGKEHLTNTTRQLYLYNHLGWDYPDAIHYGRLKMVGAVLSKSKIRSGIEGRLFTGWDDPRLGTLMALRRRGVAPEAVRAIMIDIGPKPVDAILSWDNIYAHNRKILDPAANRYFFVGDPIRLIVEKIDEPHTAAPPLHPDYPERGRRRLRIEPKNGRASLLVSSGDLRILKMNRIVRLMGLFNIEVKKIRRREVKASFHSKPYLEAKKLGAPLIHWLPGEGNIKVKVVMPTAEFVEGFGERSLKNEDVNSIVQMERFGFGRIDSKFDDQVLIYYAHR